MIYRRAKFPYFAPPVPRVDRLLRAQSEKNANNDDGDLTKEFTPPVEWFQPMNLDASHDLSLGQLDAGGNVTGQSAR